MLHHNLQVIGAGNNLMIGVGDSHSVLHRTYEGVMKSLIDKNKRMHKGDSRYLYKFTNNVSIKKQQSCLPPKKGKQLINR